MANHGPLCLSPWRRHNTTILRLQNPFSILLLFFSPSPLFFFYPFPFSTCLFSSAFILMFPFFLFSSSSVSFYRTLRCSSVRVNMGMLSVMLDDVSVGPATSLDRPGVQASTGPLLTDKLTCLHQSER